MSLLPAASMDGGNFYQAAHRAGLPTDIDTLNKIVAGVNRGLTPEQAAQQVQGKGKSMGLLSNLIGTGIDDPRFAATTQLAQGLLSSPRLMQGLATGLGGYQQAIAQARQQKAADEMRQMKMAQERMQMEAAQREQQKAQGIENAYRNAMRTPEQMAMAQNGGPTLAAAQAAPGMQGGFDQNALMRGLSQADPMTAFKMMQPQQADYKVVGNSLVQIGPNGVKEAYRPPEKPETTSDLKEYMYSRDKEGFKGTFRDWQLENNRSKATSVSVNTGERIPANLVKAQDEMIDRTLNAKAIDADLSVIEKQIADGKLKFGPVENALNQGRNLLGVSNEGSRAFASFRTTLEKLRNDSLRLNTGVQTDGDAQREWNALFQNVNDTEYVKERLGEIRKINQRAAVLQRERLNVLRRNSGAGELALPDVKPAIGGGSSLTPAEQAELAALRAKYKGSNP